MQGNEQEERVPNTLRIGFEYLDKEPRKPKKDHESEEKVTCMNCGVTKPYYIKIEDRRHYYHTTLVGKTWVLHVCWRCTKIIQRGRGN